MAISKRAEALVGKKSYGFEDLVEVMEILRSEDGCPWDREQDHHTIRDDLIEETYEVIEAIDTDNPELLREELGDVMLQVVFHSRIAEESGIFNIDDVANDICVKLIHRHPHVFGEISVENSAEVLSNWEKIKSDEKERKTVTQKLRSVPPQLPALMRATKVGKKASCFDFETTEAVMDKLAEEMVEVSEAIDSGVAEDIEEEIGDLLLTVTSLCRKTGVKAEDALNRATEKFINRFEKIENAVIDEGKDIKDLPMTELDAIWDKIKEKN
ncbi:MAG: nucleoside triphosphate pyrophosphohydrolase [Ruminococcaceae bacterium]|nr:nucleoside triphosphate pyrophosphohydrolase [Oscillospiraceae bacterium]